jgi:hypothetical protein
MKLKKIRLKFYKNNSSKFLKTKVKMTLSLFIAIMKFSVYMCVFIYI